MENRNVIGSTSTSDSAAGVRTIVVTSGRVSRRAEIVLRHRWDQRWCSTGGDWVDERARAVRFATNLDALVYCQALGVRGFVTAFDESGRRLYELNVDRILDAVSADPYIQSVFSTRPEASWDRPFDPPKG